MIDRVLMAPYTLKSTIIEGINREAENARQGKPASIQAKMNSLNDPDIIRALYEASRAGVKIDLMVRGLTTLRPGVPGMSETITVRSILGQYLEHTRVFYFENDTTPQVFAASADWMNRNLFQRVETCFPILDEKLRKRVIEEGLEIYLKDNCQASVMQPDGSYRRLAPAQGEEAISAQARLREMLSGQAAPQPVPLPKRFRGGRRAQSKSSSKPASDR